MVFELILGEANKTKDIQVIETASVFSINEKIVKIAAPNSPLLTVPVPHCGKRGRG
jgi:hypothetical protein